MVCEVTVHIDRSPSKNAGDRRCAINDVLLHAVIVDLMHSKFVGHLGNMPEGRYMVFFGKISACRQVSGY
jgi:hypothetical protein